MEKMREMFAIDPDTGKWRARFSVCDGMGQFDFDCLFTNAAEYREGRAKAVEALRELMAKHMMTEADLVHMQQPSPNLRPDWLPK